MHESRTFWKKLLWGIVLFGSITLLSCFGVKRFIIGKNETFDLDPCSKIIRENPMGDFKEILYIDTCRG